MAIARALEARARSIRALKRRAKRAARRDRTRCRIATRPPARFFARPRARVPRATTGRKHVGAANAIARRYGELASVRVDEHVGT